MKIGASRPRAACGRVQVQVQVQVQVHVRARAGEAIFETDFSEKELNVGVVQNLCSSVLQPLKMLFLCEDFSSSASPSASLRLCV
jgi:hypothetical protein